jgi:hypothetical protein
MYRTREAIMDTTAANLTSGESFPVVIPPDSELMIVARRLGVEDQLPGVVAMTEGVFSSPVQVQVARDPELPEDESIVLRVRAHGEVADLAALQSIWCQRVGAFDGNRCVFVLQLVPIQ